MIAFINGLPTWIKAIIYIVVAVWGIEIFLLPFKFNLFFRNINKIAEKLEQTAVLTKGVYENTTGLKELILALKLLISNRAKKEGKNNGA